MYTCGMPEVQPQASQSTVTWSQNVQIPHTLKLAQIPVGHIWLRVVQKFVIRRAGLEPGGAGVRARGPRRRQLAWIVAPRVLHLLVPLLRQEHEPPLARGLVVL
eukprot:5489525-Prymnesium_polylepis.1